ncbi:MAG: universal stress protein [Chloroflexi bacterium]|nr:universal stress protein [Chloroflexota bacterium]
MSQKVLVPLDGSELGSAALSWAEALAASVDHSLVLVRVVPWPPYVPVSGIDGYFSPTVYDEIVQAEEEAAHSYLVQTREHLLARGVEAETVVREGATAESILDVADEVGAYAIVMVTHGRGGLKRLVLGSVAEQIVQQSTLPVLLLRAGSPLPAAAPTFRRLLVPVDGSALAEDAIVLARQVLPKDGAIVLVRVVPPVERYIAAADGSMTIVDEEATKQAVLDAREYVQRCANELTAEGLAVEMVVQEGRPGTDVLEVAKERRADVIVMATHGRGGAARWLLGSVADEVVRHADRPVFLVSARARAARAVGAFTVRDLMTRDLASVRDDEPLSSVIRKLVRRRVSGAPVLDGEGVLVGIVSEHDLLRWQKALTEELRKAPSIDPSDYARRLETTPAKQVMRHPPLTIDEGAPLSAAIDEFLNHGVRRLVVTDDGKLRGILSRSDVVRAMAQHFRDTAGSALPSEADA